MHLHMYSVEQPLKASYVLRRSSRRQSRSDHTISFQGVQSNVAPQPVGFEAGFKGFCLSACFLYDWDSTTDHYRCSTTYRKSPPSECRSIWSVCCLHREFHRWTCARYVFWSRLRSLVWSTEFDWIASIHPGNSCAYWICLPSAWSHTNRLSIEMEWLHGHHWRNPSFSASIRQSWRLAWDDEWHISTWHHICHM